MRMQKLISAGFATAALASASIPALAWTIYPDVDFEWYANVGKPLAPAAIEITMPAPRAGYIWSPGHWETRGTRQTYVAGHWIRDDYVQQLAVYNNPNGTTTYASGPVILYDKSGNIIPTQPESYPVDSAR
jgi:YXWGXW repeat-containing protein